MSRSNFASADNSGLRDTWVFEVPLCVVHEALREEVGLLEDLLGRITPLVLRGDKDAKQHEAQVGRELDERTRWAGKIDALMQRGQGESTVPLDWDDLEFFGLDHYIVEEKAPVEPVIPRICDVCRKNAEETGFVHLLSEERTGEHVLFFRPGVRIADYLAHNSLTMSCHQCGTRNEYTLPPLAQAGPNSVIRCTSCSAVHVLNVLQRREVKQLLREKEEVIPHG